MIKLKTNEWSCEIITNLKQFNSMNPKNISSSELDFAALQDA